ncbi:MAG TPA: hypothetical protein VFU04_07465 [Solirubrobacterales bacterium]|nr:hypothetical protein [Solirubrobacterales bacterium]
MAEEAYFGIAIEISTELQRRQVQDVIKRNTDAWWHEMPDFWLVKGKSAEAWRGLLGSIFPTVGSGKLIVVKIDTASSDTWASRAKFTDSALRWLNENL